MSPVELAVVAGLGLLLGVRHATDADHVVAVATIVARARRSGGAWRIGALWGLGHTATIVGVGAAILLLKVAIPERVALSFEFLVGAVLAVMGVSNLAAGGSLLGEGLHSHAHGEAHHHEHAHEAGDGHDHPHVHVEDRPRLQALAGALAPAQAWRSFALGLVHGLAGSAGVALLVLAAIPDPWLGVLYLCVFGLGTLLGMAFVTALMERAFAAAAGRLRVERWLAPATGLSSFLFGGWMMWRIGWVDGLFR